MASATKVGWMNEVAFAEIASATEVGGLNEKRKVKSDEFAR